MITAVAFLAFASGSWYQASGIPSSGDAAAKNVRVLIHSVKFNITDNGVDVNSMTLFKNDSDRAVSLWVNIPRWTETSMPNDDRAPFEVTGAWDKTPLSIRGRESNRPAFEAASISDTGLAAHVTFEAKGTHALKLYYHVQPGVTGYEDKQRLIVYGLGGADSWAGPIEKLDVAFTYTQQQVFGLPTMEPGWQWQVGRTGAFIRRENYSAEGAHQIRMTYYPGGF